MRTLTVLGLTALIAFARSARAEVPDQMIADLNDHDRHHQHGGITEFVEMGLDTLGEDDAHRPQVEKVQDQLHDCMEPVETQERAVLLTVADGVASGAVDAAKVKTGAGTLRTTAEGLHACVAGPLNVLHGALVPAERIELADKVRAHWMVWKQVNHDAKFGGREADGWLADLTTELSLKPDQVEKLSTALQAAAAKRTEDDFDAEKVTTQVKAFGKAFVGDAFDANSVTTNSTAFLSSHGLLRMGLFYETVAPLLDAKQRETLAAHLREHADHHPTVANQ